MTQACHPRIDIFLRASCQYQPGSATQAELRTRCTMASASAAAALHAALTMARVEPALRHEDAGVSTSTDLRYRRTCATARTGSAFRLHLVRAIGDLCARGGWSAVDSQGIRARQLSAQITARVDLGSQS